MKLQRYTIRKVDVIDAEPIEGEMSVVKHSDALDWFLSLLVPVERSCGCDPQYCTCGLVWDAIDDHLEEIAALIEAERSKV